MTFGRFFDAVSDYLLTVGQKNDLLVRPEELSRPLSGRAARVGRGEDKGAGDDASCDRRVAQDHQFKRAAAIAEKPLLSFGQRGEAHFDPLSRHAR
jgi:hypothetical protein